MVSRRLFISDSLRISAGSMLLLGSTAVSGASDHISRQSVIGNQLAMLEAEVDGRLGVCIINTALPTSYGYRADERFMMLSSFKLLASALVLHRVDQGEESLQRRIHYQVSELVPWSPVTEKHLADGMTLGQLCEATLTTSDNTAANLILESFGGPQTVTRFARGLGDQVTRLDRYEPELNQPSDNGLMDTTSPAAMAGTMQTLLLGDALSEASRLMLQNWLRHNTTGDKRLRAGLPAAWSIGDKTGTSSTAANDIGIVWPPQQTPILVTAYLSDTQVSGSHKDAVLAAVGRLVYESVNGSGGQAG
jgi:beta-lactamase class A